MAEIIDISKTVVSYELPNSKDTEVFGPSFWAAFHDLANRVPCDGCRDHAKSFMVFWHDLVNLRKGAKLYDEKNFKEWLNRISELQEERKKRTDRKILALIAGITVAILLIVILRK